MDTTNIELYKPNPSVIKAFDVDMTLPDNELVFDIFKKLVLARRTQDAVFLAIGKMLKIIRDKNLYKFLDFENFGQFLASEEISFSKEKAYMTIRVYEYYSEYLEMSEDSLKDFPIVRLSMMLPILKKIDNKEDQIKEIDRMRSLRHNDFVREVKTSTNMDGKPTMYFSTEANKWIINYYENTTALVSLGEFIKPDE